MAEIGADPEQLDSLADELQRAAAALSASGGSLDRRLQGASWWGPDARRFRVGWQGQRGSLRAAADTLASTARRLRAEAGEQRAASEATSPGSVAPSMPLSSERWQLDLGAGAGIDLGAQGSLTVDDLPGPTSRVTLELDGAIGGGAGLGGGVELHGADALGGEARADAGAAVVSSGSATWVVADDEAVGFGRARAVEAAIDLVPGMATARSGLQSLLGHSPPSPESRTAMVGVALTVTAAGAAGPLSGRARGTTTAQIGVRRRGEDTSLVLHLEGAGAATLPGLLFGEPAARRDAAAVESDVEVFPARGGTRTVVITSTSLHGDEAVRLLTTIQLDDAAAGSALEAAWDDLARGDVDDAADRLRHLDDAVRSVQLVSEDGEVSSTAHGATVTAGDGPRAEGGAELTHRRIDWRR
jgi:hypothetical protein